MEHKTAIITNVFTGNGSGVHSRVWVHTDSGDYSFDVISLDEARQYQRGQTITIKVVDGRAFPA